MRDLSFGGVVYVYYNLKEYVVLQYAEFNPRKQTVAIELKMIRKGCVSMAANQHVSIFIVLTEYNITLLNITAQIITFF